VKTFININYKLITDKKKSEDKASD